MDVSYRIGPKLIPWIYPKSVLVSSKMDDFDLFFEVMGVDFNMQMGVDLEYVYDLAS